MAEKRYESDLTGKEKRELEKQKLRSMTLKEKIGYIFTYYRLHMLGVAAVCVLLYFIGNMIYRSRFETVFEVAVVNAYDMQGTAMAEDFKSYVEDEDKYHQYIVDTSMVYTGQEENDYSSIMKLSTLTGTQDLDMILTAQDQFEQYAKEDSFLPMKELLTREQIERYGDAVSDYGIHVTDSEKLKAMGMPEGSDVWMGAFIYTQHTENVKAFISYIMGE